MIEIRIARQMGLGGTGKGQFKAVEQTLETLERHYLAAKTEFFQFLGDLWVEIVQSTAIAGPPAAAQTLLVMQNVNSGKLVLGWHNFVRGNAAERFSWRKEMFDGEAHRYFRQFFGTGNLKNLRDRIATERVKLQSDAGILIRSGDNKAKKEKRVTHAPRKGNRRIWNANNPSPGVLD